MKRQLSLILTSCKRALLHACSTNRFFVSVFFFITRSYQLEQHALLSGIKRFSFLAKQEKTSVSLLRRNIHRLEKGLIMQPRKAQFAVDYIYQTVEIFENHVNQSNAPSSELDWAFCVLDYYFDVVALEHEAIKLSCVLFKKIKYTPKSLASKPFNYKEKRFQTNIFQELVHKRKSVRWFKDNSAPSPETIRKAVDIAMQAPSACNRQSFEYHFITEGKLLAQLLALPGGVVGFANNIPSLMVVVGDYSGYYLERDRHLIYIDSSLSTMLMLLAIEEMGFNSCVLNWPENDRNNQKINKILSLPSYKKVIMLIALGQGENEGGIPYSHKKDASSVLTIHNNE